MHSILHQQSESFHKTLNQDIIKHGANLYNLGNKLETYSANLLISSLCIINSNSFL